MAQTPSNTQIKFIITIRCIFVDIKSTTQHIGLKVQQTSRRTNNNDKKSINFVQYLIKTRENDSATRVFNSFASVSTLTRMEDEKQVFCLCPVSSVLRMGPNANHERDYQQIKRNEIVPATINITILPRKAYSRNLMLFFLFSVQSVLMLVFVLCFLFSRLFVQHSEQN